MSIRKAKKTYKIFYKRTTGHKIKRVPEFLSYIYWDWDKIVWKS